MKIREINRLKSGVIVPEFVGRVVKVYTPKDPTPGQAAKGIHKQTLEVQATDGEPLRVVLMKKEHHLSHQKQGCLFQFQSTKDDRDRLGGLVTCEWHDNQKDEDHFYLEVTGQAHFFEVKEGADKTASDIGKVERAGNPKAAKQLASGEFTPSVQDHVNFYCAIVEGMEERLGNSKLFDSILSDPQPLFGSATSIFIQGCQNGTFRRFVGSPVTSNAGVGQYQEQDAAAREPLPELAYDSLVAQWRNDGEEQSIIDGCYDYLKAQMSRGGRQVSAADVCAEIVRNPEDFTALFPRAKSEREKQRAAKAANGPQSPVHQQADAAQEEEFDPSGVFTEDLLDTPPQSIA